jgi:hypothetical protein
MRTFEIDAKIPGIAWVVSLEVKALDKNDALSIFKRWVSEQYRAKTIKKITCTEK